MTLERNDRRLDEADGMETGEPVDGEDRGAADETRDEQDVAEVRSEIEDTRVEMGATLQRLGDRLEPAHLVQEAKDNVRDATIGRVEETAKGMSDMVMQTIKENPIPAAMAGAGLALLWMNRSNGRGGQQSTSGRYWYGADGSAVGYAPRAGSDRYRQDDGAGIGDRAGEMASSVGQVVGETAEHIGQRAEQIGRGVGEAVGQGAHETGWRLERFMQSSPLAVGAIAAGAGALVGALLPETPPERQVLGEASRAVSETVRETVSQAADKAEQQLDEVEREQRAEPVST